jgi:hypothetical protein
LDDEEQCAGAAASHGSGSAGVAVASPPSKRSLRAIAKRRIDAVRVRMPRIDARRYASDALMGVP